jgi:hypothetical protein
MSAGPTGRISRTWDVVLWQCDTWSRRWKRQTPEGIPGKRDSGARKETGVTNVTTEEKVHTETVEVKGDDLLAKVKEIVHEGNVRRITITDKEGHRLMEIPLTVGVVGVVLLPVFAAVGALAALVAECTIEVQRVETK